MASASIHQAIHGYRDGHRLLGSSVALGSDAARSMLVLSDMSGPSMQAGFNEYLTGYPLSSTDFFVLAKTWYAPEMQRPGCVWTHSLLIARSEITQVTAGRLLREFRRPQLEGVELVTAAPIVIDDDPCGDSQSAGFEDRAIAGAMIGAVFGQARPVVVVADTASQFEAVFLRLWEEMWPAERARFSFCSGALMPRSNAGALLDLQAVPRAIPASQFRKSSGAALFLDLRAPSEPAAWVESLLDSAARGDATFRTWLEMAAGDDAGRYVVPSLAPIFEQWHAPNSSAQSVLPSVVGATLDASVRRRLIAMVFDRADNEDGATRRRELLQDLCVHRDSDLAPVAATLEGEARRLFDESRADGTALVLSLLGADLTAVGEQLLRAAVLWLEPTDLQAFGDAQAAFLPTIVGANPQLACSSVLWNRVGGRSAEVLSQLGSMNLGEAERGAVVDAILSSGCDVSVDALIGFGGKTAVFRGLTALSSGQIPLSWHWRSAVSKQSGIVLEWLETISRPSPRDLELGSRFLTPKSTQTRLAKVWGAGTAGRSPLSPRTAAFGLTLAFWEGVATSSLLGACFQPTYDAAGSSRLEYEEWDWLLDYAPSISWYRDWDKCERLAAAVARLFEKQDAPLDTVFGVVQSRAALGKVTAILDSSWKTRPYLESLRKAAAGGTVGTREQRDALLQSG